MKKIKHFSKIIALSLLLALLLPTVIGAALPPTVSPQYTNVYDASCEFIFDQDFWGISCRIIGMPKCTITATLTLYLVMSGGNEVAQVSYNYTATSLLSVMEAYDNFYAGFIYKLKLDAIVVCNGIRETITEEVTMVSP